VGDGESPASPTKDMAGIALAMLTAQIEITLQILFIFPSRALPVISR
jgi:hypothetical protein